MGAVTVNPVQTTTYDLNVDDNPITFGLGTDINVASGDAVDGGAGVGWSVTNTGTIISSAEYGAGISFVGVGSVTNLIGGYISGVNSGVRLSDGGSVVNQASAKISSDVFGVSVAGGVGTVTNSGDIVSANGKAVDLNAGGAVYNLAGGAITGFDRAIYIEGGVGTVTNAGNLGAGVHGSVTLVDGGSIANSGAITGGANIQGGLGSLVNSGAIGHFALLGGGSVKNEKGGSIGAAGAGFGVILGFAGEAPKTGVGGGNLYNYIGGTISGEAGVFGGSSLATVTNAGSITGTTAGTINVNGGVFTVGDGVSLNTGGTVTNQSSGSITGVRYGVYITGGSGTVDNAGMISGFKRGVYFKTGVGTVTNTGVISNSAADYSVIRLNAGGSVVNEAGASIDGSDGVYIQGGIGTVTNAGTFTGGVWLQSYGSVTNEATGQISGGDPQGAYGVGLHAGGSVINFGQISGLYLGVEVDAGGTVTNEAGASSAGKYFGVLLGFPGQTTGGGGVLSNAADATITGDSGVLSGGAAATITNAGSIVGTTAETITKKTVTATLGDGVSLNAGGSVTNQTTGTIIGASDGVYVTGGAGAVANSGTITATSGTAIGVKLSDGGTVDNNTTGVIAVGGRGIMYGVYISGAAGTVTNEGLISGQSTYSPENLNGVRMTAGGVLDNLAGAKITAENFAVNMSSGSITNAGEIDGTVLLANAGTVTNESGGVVTGTIFLGPYNPGDNGGGAVDNQAGASLQGATGIFAAGSSATVTNAGQVVGTTDTSLTTDRGTFIVGDGVSLNAGGVVTNQSGGSISGARYGVYITGGAGTITNSGTITAPATTSDGVVLNDGGVIINEIAGDISAGNFGVEIAGAEGTLANAGTIAGTSHYAVWLLAGGSVANLTGATIDGATEGIYLSSGGTVTNAGTITGVAVTGVQLRNGGAVTNQTGGTIGGGFIGVTLGFPGQGGGGNVTNDASATISGDSGVFSTGAAATVTNAGTIVGTTSKEAQEAGVTLSLGAGVSLADGGSVTNQSGGTISGVYSGVSVRKAMGTISNAGTITASAPSYGYAVQLYLGGTVINYVGGDIQSTLGVFVNGAVGSVTNAGSITGTKLSGVELGDGGSVINQSGGKIYGGVHGVLLGGPGGGGINQYSGYPNGNGGGLVTNLAGGTISGDSGVVAVTSAATVTNAGSITGTTGGTVTLGMPPNTVPVGFGVGLAAGGVVTNQTSGSITGARYGVYITGGAGAVVNAGTISGPATAIEFAGAGANTLTLQTGSTLTGAVVGSTASGATNALILQGAGAADNAFENFNTLDVEASGVWTLGGDNSIGATTVASGTLDVTGALTSAVTLAGGNASFEAASSANVTFAEQGTLSLFAPYSGAISGFTGTGGTTSDVIDVAGSGHAGDQVFWSQNGASGTLLIEDAVGNILETLTLDGAYYQNQFLLTDPASVDQIAYDSTAPCFARGTRILTARGEVAVEALVVGDLAVTASGSQRPIVWIGRRRLDLSRHIRPERVNPVRIEAGALAPNVPARDLVVSPEHALWLDDAFVCAGDLVNGATVRQEAWREVEYFHVELESHDILLAEGAPAESYLDCGNRRNFENGGDGVTLHPEWTASADPRLFASPTQLARTQAGLCARAAALGRAAALAAYRAYEQARAEAPRENAVCNPRGEGAVRGRIGEGGAAPVGWWCDAPRGVAVEIAGSGVEAGLPYVDIRFAGRAEAAAPCAIYPALGTGVSAQRGQDWTFSAYLRRVGGGWGGVGALNLYFDEYGASGDYLDGEPRAIRLPGEDGLALQRVSATHRMRRREARSVTGYVQATVEAGAAVDLTLRLAGFQIERGDYASGLLLPAEGVFGPTRREGRRVAEAA